MCALAVHTYCVDKKFFDKKSKENHKPKHEKKSEYKLIDLLFVYIEKL